MGSFEKVNEWLEDNEVPDYVREAFSGSTLRTKLEEAESRATKAEKELEKVTGKLSKIERQPVLKKSLEQLSVDYDALPKYGRRAVDSFDWEGDEPDLTQLAEFLENEGFEVQVTTDNQEDKPAAAQVAAQAQVGADRFIKQDSEQEQIAKAEAAGDWETSRRLKTQLAQKAFSS